MSVLCECCVLSGRGMCDGPTFRPGESSEIERERERERERQRESVCVGH